MPDGSITISYHIIYTIEPHPHPWPSSAELSGVGAKNWKESFFSPFVPLVVVARSRAQSQLQPSNRGTVQCHRTESHYTIRYDLTYRAIYLQYLPISMLDARVCYILTISSFCGTGPHSHLSLSCSRYVSYPTPSLPIFPSPPTSTNARLVYASTD